MILLLVCTQTLGLGCASLWPGPFPERPAPPPGGMWVPESEARGAGGRARGRVFDDRNRDGIHSSDEPGIAGVSVSNGRDVVTTDADGRFEVAVGDDTAIFVIKPRDWRTPISEEGLPRFYYLHKPAGSPDDEFAYAGVEPTGPLPESIDFPLYTHPEPERFDVVVVADPQPYDLDQLAYYARDTVAELEGTDAQLALVLGDIVGNDLSLFEPVNQIQSLVGIPVYNVIGNHDLNFRSPDDAHSDETYERIYGPATYAFQVGPVHFGVLDNVIWGGFEGHYRSDGRTYNQNYVGAFRQDQIEFLENWLATVPKDELVVLAMHIPIEPETRDGERQSQRLFEILSGHPKTLSLAGHRHRQEHRYFGAADGYRPERGGDHHHYIVGAASGSWFRGAPDEEGIPHARMRDGGPKGYAIASFDGDRYALRYKASRRPADYQLHIDAPDVIDAGRRALVTVNVFNGGPRSQVEWRLRRIGEDRSSASPSSSEARDWEPLRRRRQTDPSYERLRIADAVWRAPWTPLPEAKLTDHLWIGRLPEDLAPGVYWVEVRARDSYGLDVRGRRALRVGVPEPSESELGRGAVTD